MTRSHYGTRNILGSGLMKGHSKMGNIIFLNFGLYTHFANAADSDSMKLFRLM